MRIFKKILTIILSIGLLVVISCGDRPTGSNPVNIDEIINSIPTTEGKPLATDLNVEAVYTNKLTGYITQIMNGESYSGETSREMGFILAISNNNNNRIYFGEMYETGDPTSPNKIKTNIYLTNEQLYKDGSLYIARRDDKNGTGNFADEEIPCEYIYYIEFTKSGDNIDIKSIMSTLYESKNYVSKREYKGTLIKDTSSSGS